jgi:hypothetical protein
MCSMRLIWPALGRWLKIAVGTRLKENAGNGNHLSQTGPVFALTSIKSACVGLPSLESVV